MIVYKTGDIFETECNVICNPVNIDGVMDDGLAARVKEKYPDMFKMYQKLCLNRKFSIGNLLLLKVEKNKFILNFPTAVHKDSPSSIEMIDLGLQHFINIYKKSGIKSIAIPKLGCGAHGGLNWYEVKRLLCKYLNSLPISIEIYE